ncbi:unnamed protein product [Medioppia subpectinata]|uniref:Protein quiver n=1 Tax=Medioppia subpectinata TaxID=1979941 RepID=A0A7R9LI79_9ACAR|nr:unnamed protein product [Medioppia subpectinata]CAG2119102.1 unnamed protein product [Medioppia subpectinata]
MYTYVTHGLDIPVWLFSLQFIMKTNNILNLLAAVYILAESVVTGQIGTKRFCSSRDYGDYCDYVRRPGDERDYRSCIFTCTGDGCNHSSHLYMSTIYLFSLILFSCLYFNTNLIN